MTAIKDLSIVFAVVLLACSSPVDRIPIRSNIVVPDSASASRMAEAIWIELYGDVVLNSKPYRVRLVGDTCWVVQGTLHTPLGGVPYMELRKSDGMVLRITHTK